MKTGKSHRMKRLKSNRKLPLELYIHGFFDYCVINRDENLFTISQKNAINEYHDENDAKKEQND